MDNHSQHYAGPRTYISAVLLIIAFISFLIIMYGINSGIEFSWEQPTQRYFQNWNEGYVHTFFKIWTELGSRLGIGLVTLALIIWLGWKSRDFVAVGISAILVVGADRLNVFVKELVGRDRPAIDPSIDAVGYSFPSGHAMLSIVTYGIIAYFVSRKLKKMSHKTLAWFIAILIIIITGISRIVLSAHYPTDVVAGYCLGFVLLIIAIKCYGFLSASINKKFKTKK